MSTFIFNKKVENQIKDFKNFVKTLQNCKTVKINFHAGEKTTINTVRESLEKIDTVLKDDVEIKFNIEIDKKLNEDEIIIILNFN